jgi:hypothetical protein
VAAPYILARNLRDAHTFAREELGLRQGHYRIVNSASTVKSVRGADLYLVPGWANRYDRFAMKGAMRWTRMNVIDVAEQPAQREDPRGPLTDDLLDLAYAEDIVRSGGDTTALGFKSESDGLTPPGEQMVIDIPDERPPAFIVRAVPDDVEPPQYHKDIVAQVLPDRETEPGVKDAEPTPEQPKNRRRSRCKECGNLHFKGDPCPAGDS